MPRNLEYDLAKYFSNVIRSDNMNEQYKIKLLLTKDFNLHSIWELFSKGKDVIEMQDVMYTLNQINLKPSANELLKFIRSITKGLSFLTLDHFKEILTPNKVLDLKYIHSEILSSETLIALR